MAPSEMDLDETKVPVLIGTCVFFLVLAVAAISLRFYARHFSRNKLWWDDWLALAGVPFALLPPIFDLVQINNGFGRHQTAVLAENPKKLERYGYLLYILLLFYNPGLALFKYSFLALYIRLFPVVRWLRFSCYGVAALITIWTLANEFALIFRCNPIKANWDPSAGTCISQQTIFLAQSIPTIFFDIVIIALPTRLIWNIQMARSSKFSVLGVFLLGGLVTIMSIVRLVYTLTSSNADLTFGFVDLGLWSAAEPITGLVCCCLPAYSPLLRAFLHRTGLVTKSIGSGARSGASKTDHSSHLASTYNDTTHLGGGAAATGMSHHHGTSDTWAGAGYSRSQGDSDTFELTNTGDGRIVRKEGAGLGGEAGQASRVRGTRSDSDSMDSPPYGSIQVTKMVSVSNTSTHAV